MIPKLKDTQMRQVCVYRCEICMSLLSVSECFRLDSYILACHVCVCVSEAEHASLSGLLSQLFVSALQRLVL